MLFDVRSSLAIVVGARVSNSIAHYLMFLIYVRMNGLRRSEIPVCGNLIKTYEPKQRYEPSPALHVESAGL